MSPLKSQVLYPEAFSDTVATASSPVSRNLTPLSFSQPGKDYSTTSAPPVPAPRRSTERRREPPPPPQASTTIQEANLNHSRDITLAPTSTQAIEPLLNDQNTAVSDFPETEKSNRRPPRFKQRPYHILTDYDTRLLAVCGDFICTTGYITKAWSMRTGELLMNMEHRETSKMLSIIFKPSLNIEDEGKRIWLGSSTGDIHEVDIISQRIVKTKSQAHPRREIIRMFRFATELWTLDDSGDLNVWKPDHKGIPSLDSQFVSRRVPKGHGFAIACGSQLWIAHGKELRVFSPGARQDSEFYITRSPLVQSGAGDITCGAIIDSHSDLVYFGHTDGKVSIYDTRNFSCSAVVTASLYRIISLSGAGDYLWAGFSTGMAYVYDTKTTPWTVKKDWQAHDKQICSIVSDPSGVWKMGRLVVATLGLDNMVKLWDGILEDDWLMARLSSRDQEYCSFRELTLAVLTWNAGASKPSQLQHSDRDGSFYRDYIRSHDAPDLFVFGFQEVVDLEDKKVISKSLFRSKKKDPSEQEHTSQVYRAWRDYLVRCLEEHVPGRHGYTLLHTASMVGLFTCVFVKTSERGRIRHVHTSEVKRGMGGSLGNKGAILIRLVVDDSSICFVNCHLAAGQTQTINRNNDAAAILEAKVLPAFPIQDNEVAKHSDVFTNGGDGSMILDHEICVLNGDLNYRIDTMGRETVIKHVQQGNFARLLERDQLLLSRKRNPGFRLRAFHESPITFAPTYKYNLNSDEYDTSEKRRAPAWCDRIMYRGIGKVKMEDYRRWDQIRVSDHRPVSGYLRLRVKAVDGARRERIWSQCLDESEAVRQRIARDAQ
jgi:WD40 repeat protein